ncbi:hypothetical protein PR048_006823 [Dryococelus australis]|uniref:Uncharacterized protein n=1 Tax=Dryococelus australis TaxID=614101 RepID=A0ABQ9IC09_9NEOP|nr:hypothetical protein PR048_006823 [Dryococelus australis]
MSMLSLFLESSNSPAMMLHSMNVVTACVKYLNPNQTPVLIGDQPLFVLMNRIQYSLLEEHGEDKFVVMIGGLHIKPAALRMAGHWLEGSGGRGKLKAWDAWTAFPETTDAFAVISEGNLDSVMDNVEKFVIILYDRSCEKNTGE